MSMSTPTPAQAAARYRVTQVQASTPLERVVLLYDGAIRFMDAAKSAIARRDIPARRDALSRAIGIVGQLKSTLDMERGGDVAAALDRLYGFVTSRLLDAARLQDARPIDECLAVFESLREGWRTIAADAQRRSA
jgi:flagellar protein FliS